MLFCVSFPSLVLFVVVLFYVVSVCFCLCMLSVLVCGWFVSNVFVFVCFMVLLFSCFASLFNVLLQGLGAG